MSVEGTHLDRVVSKSFGVEGSGVRVYPKAPIEVMGLLGEGLGFGG